MSEVCPDCGEPHEIDFQGHLIDMIQGAAAAGCTPEEVISALSSETVYVFDSMTVGMGMGIREQDQSFDELMNAMRVLYVSLQANRAKSGASGLT